MDDLSLQPDAESVRGATVLSQKPPSYVTCTSKELRERRVGYAQTQSCLTGRSRQDLFTAVMLGLEVGSYQCVHRFRAGYLRLTSELAQPWERLGLLFLLVLCCLWFFF